MAVSSFIRHRTNRFYPLAFGILLCLWGLWLLLPGASYASTTGFDYIRLYISEEVLGAIATTIGAVQIIATLTKFIRAVSLSALGSFYFWLLLTVSFAAGDWHAPGTIVYGWFTIMSGLGYVNLRLNQQEDGLVD